MTIITFSVIFMSFLFFIFNLKEIMEKLIEFYKKYKYIILIAIIIIIAIILFIAGIIIGQDKEKSKVLKEKEKLILQHNAELEKVKNQSILNAQELMDSAKLFIDSAISAELEARKIKTKIKIIKNETKAKMDSVDSYSDNKLLQEFSERSEHYLRGVSKDNN